MKQKRSCNLFYIISTFLFGLVFSIGLINISSPNILVAYAEAVQLATPTNLVWEVGTQDSAFAFWDPVENADGYRVTLYDHLGGEFDSGDVDTTEYDFGSIFSTTICTDYYFTVVATSLDTENFLESEVSVNSPALSSYTVTFEANGGEPIDDVYVIGGQSAPEVSTTMLGYVFDNWYEDTSFQTVWDTGTVITSDKIVYANWIPNTFTVKFDKNTTDTVSGTMPDQLFTYDDQEFLTANTFVREGFVFAGWTSINGGTTVEFENESEGSTLTDVYDDIFILYAVWQENFSINFNLLGGEYTGVDGKFDLKEYVNGATFIMPDVVNVIKEGYQFDHWTDGTNNYNVGASYTVTGDATISLVWQVRTLDIYYNLNSGTNSELNPSTFTVESNAITFTNPTRDCYTFDGWFTLENFLEISRITGIPTGSQVGDIYIHAKWTPIEYLIIYHLDNGINNVDNKSSYNIETESFSILAPTKTGYTFDGWYADNSFMIGVSTTVVKGSFSDIEMYAKWAIINYTITYNLNNGANNADNLASYNVESNNFSILPPFKNGYTFNGWFTNEALTLPAQTTIEQGSTGDISVYAKWEISEYNITYNLNGGINNEQNLSAYNIFTENFSILDASRNGYNFVGWFTDENLTISAENSVEQGSTGDILLYAKWEAITYTISFDLGGGNSEQTSCEINYGSEMGALPIPTRAGYTFTGWYDEEGNLVDETSVYNIASNSTLTAGWEEIATNPSNLIWLWIGLGALVVFGGVFVIWWNFRKKIRRNKR